MYFKKILGEQIFLVRQQKFQKKMFKEKNCEKSFFVSKKIETKNSKKKLPEKVFL